MVESMIYWFVFSLAVGAMEAAIFAHGVAHQMVEKQPYNIHAWFFGFRVIMGTIFLAAIRQLGWWLIPIGIAYVLIFPFLHDGMHYEVRRWLDGTPYNWFTSENQSTAKFSFNAFVRTVMYVTGFLIWSMVYWAI